MNGKKMISIQSVRVPQFLFLSYLKSTFLKDLIQKGDNTVYFDVEFVPGETLLELGSDVGATMWLLPLGWILVKYTWFLSEKIKNKNY